MIPVPSIETTGKWTTLSEEATYLSAVAAASPHVIVEQVGVTNIEDRPLRRATITRAGGQAPTVVIFGGIHGGNDDGGEPAGREASLGLISHLASSTTPHVVDLLNRVKFVIYPTCNPIGVDRGTADSMLTEHTALNIQNDNVLLRMNESRVIAEAITQYDPLMIVDCHEYWDWGGFREGLISLSPGSLPVGAGGIMTECYRHILNHLTTAGTAGTLYNQGAGPQYSSVMSMAGYRGVPGMLIESATNDRTRAGREKRYADYMAVFDGMLAWLSTEADRLLSVREQARADFIAGVRDRTGVLDLRTGTVLDPVPMGYSDLSEWPAAFDTFGIEGSTGWVPLDQVAGYAVARLLDEDSYNPPATGSRYAPPRVGAGSARVAISGVDAERAVVDGEEIDLG